MNLSQWTINRRGDGEMRLLNKEEVLANSVIHAIQTGDTETLKQLLVENPGLATAKIADKDSESARTLLHVVTDWPGNFTNGAKTVSILVEAGADVNARFEGSHAETPLHWAASCNDVEVLDALLDAGADINITGGVIGDGTPLDDAVAFAQWKTARRLVERGANLKLWNAAALGLLEDVTIFFGVSPSPSKEEITKAFWLACHGGQRNTAQYLYQKGADIHWIGYDHLTPLGAAKRSNANELVEWLQGIGAK